MKSDSSVAEVELEHTRGPWSVDLQRKLSNTYVYGGDGFEIARVERLNRLPAESAANAHLVAAAPSLLSALKSILESEVYCCCGGGEVEVKSDGGFRHSPMCPLVIAESAIAKAEGH